MPPDSMVMGGEMGDMDMGAQKQCPDCGRRFNPTPFEKHVKICQKVFLQKRKAFDSSKMRTAGDEELQQIQAQKARAGGKKRGMAAAAEERAIPKQKGEGKWKQQSNALREAMRAARLQAQAEKNGDPLPPSVPSAPDPSLVPCPHCGRRFNEKAAKRHIPQCNNIKAKPTRLQRGAGGGCSVASSKKTPASTAAASAMAKSSGGKPRRR